MAGHNKWSKVKHRKAVVDKRRSKAWTMCSRAIITAARTGGPDPEFNFALRAALDEARYHNVPKDNIERAIKKAAGSDTGNYDAVRYEGYAPGGVAIIAEALTDNRNRTGGAIRAIFTKHEGNLGSTGSVSHMFAHVGEIAYKAAVGSADAVLEAAIEAGADDVVSDAAGHVVTCPFEMLGTVAAALERTLGDAESVKAVWKPGITTPVDEVQAETIMKIIAALEDDDDVQAVFANFEVSEEVMKKLTAA